MTNDERFAWLNEFANDIAFSAVKDDSGPVRKVSIYYSRPGANKDGFVTVDAGTLEDAIDLAVSVQTGERYGDA